MSCNSPFGWGVVRRSRGWRAVVAGGCVVVLSTIAGARAEAPPKARTSKANWGISAGMPQLLAVTREQRIHGGVGFEVSVSPLLLANSVAARVVVGKRRGRAAPYLYAGAGLLNISEGEGGGAVGTTGFGWLGAGLRVHAGRLALFADAGVLLGTDTAKGYASPMGSGSIGVLFLRK